MAIFTLNNYKYYTVLMVHTLGFLRSNKDEYKRGRLYVEEKELYRRA